MERPYAAFTGSGGRPPGAEIDLDMFNALPRMKQGIDVVLSGLQFCEV